MYAAKQFLICADKTVLLSVDNVEEALIALFNTCFVFDVNYPTKLSKLFEFLERYKSCYAITILFKLWFCTHSFSCTVTIHSRFIFKMAFLDTRVLDKNGKPIAVLTEAVKGTCEKYEKFKANVAKQLE